jgi:hypothetical protein
MGQHEERYTKRMETIEDALDPFRQSLAADGYGLRVDAVEAGVLRLSIVSQAGACEECLVPKGLMATMIRDTISQEHGIREIELTYPGER